MYTRAVTFKPLCALGTYGKPVETQIAAQKARVSSSGGGRGCISDRLPGHPDSAHPNEAPALETEEEKEERKLEAQNMKFGLFSLLFAFFRTLRDKVVKSFLLLFFQSPCLPRNALTRFCNPGWTWTGIALV